jgi:hypothetical protein
MTIKDLPADMLVKVGTVYGSNFLYAGRLGDMRIDREKCLDETWLQFYIETKKIRSEKRIKKHRLEMFLDKYHLLIDFLPIEERTIVEMAESEVEKGVYKVIVPGMESGRCWMVDESRRPSKIESNQGAELLIGAIWRDIVEDLIAAYVEIGTRRSDAAKISADKLEAEIMSNPYGATNDPVGVIDMAKKIAVERISERRGIAYARKLKWSFPTR